MIGKGLASPKKIAAGWTVIILILLCIPATGFRSTSFVVIAHADKVVHFFLFSVFAFFWHSAFSKKQIPFLSIKIFSWGTLYGILLEYVQLFPFIKRDFDVYDMIADGAGAAMVFLFSFIRAERRM